MADDTINITSYNQMGGITAQNVTVGKPPRKFDEQGKAFMLTNVPKSAKVIVKHNMGDGEGQRYANEIFDWLKANGYQNTDCHQCVFAGQPPTGQGVISNKDGSFDILVGFQE
jgi:hypothetical protein